jgi:hypothetical protein
MVNWNPNFPEVLGNEWLANIGSATRVWAGAPAAMARLPSTAAETVTALKLSATVNPLVEATIPTLVDIIEEGSEAIPLMVLAKLAPNADKTNEGWIRNDGSGTNVYQAIDEDAGIWGTASAPARATWMRTQTPMIAYACSVDATSFAAAGANQNARIGWVAVKAIMGANTGYRKLGLALEIGGILYPPAGGGVRDVHGYGAIYDFWWGEINPATNRPWTPADIANFGSAGTARIFVRSQAAATVSQYPLVYAMSLRVAYLPVENRAAVGIWTRPSEVGTERLFNVTTTDLRTMPAGTVNWSKLSGRNYLFYWRQSVSPSEYGPTVADDVSWNHVRQLLPSDGQPPGYSAPPGGVVGAKPIAHDQHGRPVSGWDEAEGTGTAAMGLVMVVGGATSTDSQPYRLDTTDIEGVTSIQKLGQRVTPTSSQSYLGVRLLAIPPATDNSTLTVAVIRISDSVQMGGTFTITASAARALPSVTGGWRYIHGFLSSAAALVSGTAYEIRLTSTAIIKLPWLAAMPDSSLGNTASFGGSTNGGFIGPTHLPDRELAVVLVKQPDPPTGVTAALANVAVTTFAGDATNVRHVQLGWTLPAVGMGAGFSRYEIERQIAAGPWERIANLRTSSLNTFTDVEAPRGLAATYRIRAVGTDGRFSAWATSTSVTPTDTIGRPMLILSSNHVASQFVHLYEITDSGDAETIYPVLSTERDETVAIHGADYQLVFMEAEDRGVGWRTRVSLKNTTLAGAQGVARFDALLDLVRSLNVPYVCAMDHQGNRVLGHVSVTEGTQLQPDYRYSAQLTITPTHSVPVPAEVI